MNKYVVEAIVTMKRDDPNSPIIELWEKNSKRMSELDKLRMANMLMNINNLQTVVDKNTYSSMVNKYSNICNLLNKQYVTDDYLRNMEYREESLHKNLKEIEKKIISEI